VEPKPLLAVLAVLCPLVAGCLPREKKEPRLPISVLVSGDTQGWIVPCGCTSNQSGGMLRRGTLLSELRHQRDVVYVDVGGAASGTSRYDRMKFEAILAGEKQMRVAAHNVGASEAALGADYLRDAGRRLAVPWVSCNVRDASGKPVADPLRIVTAGGRRLAFVGVLSDRLNINGLSIGPPRESISAVLREGQEPFDAVIVLAYLAEDELRQLAGDLPEAHVIVGGPTGQAMTPCRVGPVLLTSATNKAKFLVKLDVAENDAAASWNGDLVELNSQFVDDPRQRENLTRFYDALAAADLSATDTSFARTLPASVPRDYRIAGDASCRECHPDDSERCVQMRHARAWAALEQRGANVDPYCQQCHTNGYGLPGGFLSLRQSRSLVNVGCESCHGPSLAHQRDSKLRTPNYRRAEQRCTSCHDRENSPEFAYEKYWKQIRHGEPARKVTDPAIGPPSNVREGEAANGIKDH
jgi:hypothetical protein